jgi:E3 ubiquitin-protein ligase DOA10
MTKFLIDFWMDGYESEAAMIEAAPDYIFDNLDSAGASVKVVCHIDEDNLLNEVERLRAALDAERHINSGLQRLVENLAHAGAIKQREAIALRKAMREALQELVALRHGSAMKIIEDALGDDEFCEDGDA